ncbi:MAG: hypothetical protein F8N15_10565 [Methanobacterium sp.]|nr:hypothetical protein [Methanobacterium sp.]
MLRKLTHDDVERMFDQLANRGVDSALQERRDIQGQFNQRGLLHSSMYVQGVEQASRTILRKAVSDSMQLLTDVVARKELAYEQIKGPVLSRITNIAHRLANLVAEANQQMPQTLEMNKIRAEYEQIVKHAISDFEVGMIDGRPARSSQNVALHIGGDMSGIVQVAGDGAHQITTQTRIDHGIDLPAFAEELAALRQTICPHITNADQAIAAGRIAEAEVAAKAQDLEKTNSSLAAIGKDAARWLANTAKEIGSKLVVDYFEKHCGL